MKITLVSSALLILVATAGCRIRHPNGGCPYEDLEVSPQFVTPWDTVLEDDLAQLVGPYPGTLIWLDGDDVITVPKAGQQIEVEAEIEIDLSSSRVREYEKTPEQSVCEPNLVLIDATITFTRLSDGEVEFERPFMIVRDDDASTQYYGEAETVEIDDVVPGLVPLQDLEVEAITTSMVWGEEGTSLLLAEFTYDGQTIDSPTTGHGVFKTFARFVQQN